MTSKSLKVVGAEAIINAPKDAVWNTWSQFSNVADYAASIPKSYSLGEKFGGIGASRRCDVSSKVQVDEMITEWVPGERYAMEIIASKGIPIEIMKIAFKVDHADSGTLATIDMSYRMKGLLNLLPLKGAMRQQASDHLAGLKHHIETGEIVTQDMLQTIRARYKTNIIL